MKITSASLIIAVLIMLSFLLSVPSRTKDIPVDRTALVKEAHVETPVVALRDVYKKGVHTLSGSLSVPNPCTPVTASATTTLEATTTVAIELSLLAPTAEGLCLQMPARAVFSTTVTAPPNLPISVVVNGEVASTTR